MSEIIQTILLFGNFGEWWEFYYRIPYTRKLNEAKPWWGRERNR